MKKDETYQFAMYGDYGTQIGKVDYYAPQKEDKKKIYETSYSPFECAGCEKEYTELSDIPVDAIEYDEFIAVMLERLKSDFPDSDPDHWIHLRNDGTGYDDDIVIYGDYAHPIYVEEYYPVERKNFDAAYQLLVARHMK